MKSTADVVVIGGGVMVAASFTIWPSWGPQTRCSWRWTYWVGLHRAVSGHLPMHYSNPVTARMAWESLKVLANFEEAVAGPRVSSKPAIW